MFIGEVCYSFYEIEIADHGFYFINVIGKDPVFFCKTHFLSYVLMREFQNRAAAERTPEFDGLAGRHEFDGEDILQVLQDLSQLPAADAAHAHMIFLTQGCGNAVCAGRKAQGFIFRNERGSRILRNHKSAVESHIFHQQQGQSPFPLQ